MIDTTKISRERAFNYRRGEDHHKSKLTEEDVLGIVHLYSEGYTVASLARACGVTAGAVWQILRGTTWSWLTGIERQSEGSGQGGGDHAARE